MRKLRATLLPSRIPAKLRDTFNMPPTAAGSAPFNLPKLTSGVPSASNSQEAPQDSATGEITTAQH
ncbi:hypothetical protein KCU89_g15711, partial [Aureobasidium melanogenum]